MKLTKRQQGIINLLKKGTHSLMICFGKGGAMWDKKIAWSQGRTPCNSVSQKDIDKLLSLKILWKWHSESSSLYLYNYLIETDENIPFISSDEGYSGKSLIT